MRKGFVLTMDVMAAILIAAVFISAMMHFMRAPRLKTDEYLYIVSMDFLTVADKEGSLRDAVGGDGGSLNEFLHTVPANLCMNLTIVDEAGDPVFDNSTGCVEPPRYVIGKRTVVNETATHTARLRVWYK